MGGTCLLKSFHNKHLKEIIKIIKFRILKEPLKVAQRTGVNLINILSSTFTLVDP